MIGILILTRQIEIYAWLMLFALIHELAHTFAGILLKLKPKTLEIEPFGIGIIFESYQNTEKNKIIIALAGPIMNLLLAIIFSFVNIKARELIVNANLLLSIFNMIPIYPLDGGRIIKSILRTKKGKEETEAIVNKISNILMISITMISSLLILKYKNIALLIVIGYLWIIVIRENKKYTLWKKINVTLNKKNWQFAWLFIK